MYIWSEHVHSGSYEYDVEKKTLIQYSTEEKDPSRQLENNYVTSILRKKNGEIWISTFGAGIYQYQEGKGIVRHIGTEEGLTNEEVYTLIEYNQNIWASIDNGIAEINTKTGQVHVYDCFAGLETLEFTPQEAFASLMEKFISAAVMDSCPLLPARW